MKSFITNVMIMCLLVALSLGAIAIVNKYCLDKDNYLYEFSVKQQLIRDTPSPKVVFLGGSNVAFGLDCKTISDTLHMPVINAGLHAGLGLRFIMDNNISLLHEGDILVIMPEYSNFTDGANGNSQAIGMIPYFSSVNEMLHLNYRQGVNLLSGFGRVTMNSFFVGCKTLLRKEDRRTFKYKKSGFNDLGDEVSHLSLESGVDMEKFTSPHVDDNLNMEYINEFEKEVRSLEQRGIKVFLLPPAIYEVSYKTSQVAINAVTNALDEKGISFEVNTKQFVYPIDCMYNTEYHLNYLGVNTNTRNVIAILRALQDRDWGIHG